MAYSQARDFLFCDICGNLLSLGRRNKYAECQLCGFRRNIKEVANKETCYTVTAEDIRRELRIEPFVLLDGYNNDEGEVQRAVVNERCKACGYHELQYYTKQLRSADEGQTVFYECANCKDKYSVNT